MGGDWKEKDRVEFGGVLHEVDRFGVGFNQRAHFLGELRALGRKEPALAQQVVLAITKATDGAELVQQLRELIDHSIAHFFGSGAAEILGLWRYASEYDVKTQLPTDPGMVRVVHESMDLFLHLHGLHWRGGVSVISVLEEGLALLIQSHAGVYDAEPREVLPPLPLQRAVMEFFLKFEDDSVTGVHEDVKDPVRQRVQRCFIALCAEYEEDLVLGLRDKWQGTCASELVDRGLIGRFGRGPVLDGFLADRKRRLSRPGF